MLMHQVKGYFLLEIRKILKDKSSHSYLQGYGQLIINIFSLKEVILRRKTWKEMIKGMNLLVKTVHDMLFIKNQKYLIVTH